MLKQRPPTHPVLVHTLLSSPFAQSRQASLPQTAPAVTEWQPQRLQRQAPGRVGYVAAEMSGGKDAGAVRLHRGWGCRWVGRWVAWVRMAVFGCACACVGVGVGAGAGAGAGVGEHVCMHV
jgi:hypothetical protein